MQTWRRVRSLERVEGRLAAYPKPEPRADGREAGLQNSGFWKRGEGHMALERKMGINKVLTPFPKETTKGSKVKY
ncbi:hypothetical protein D8674_025137 [Pyrus ussuriensis x Pyrus communis]|uniref:Uncharacterized protein n=1 Tax=Pyrus ussuriensis x Pyrus communis TaxID=2448454 RepID=A0A5N5H4S8_9ROSA|nr:hypothetical protein D8674_025137 [Pyrus ussuriensis x Pyrus communis]